MNKLLNNPVIVLLLVLGAGFVLYENIIAPFWGPSDGAMSDTLVSAPADVSHSAASPEQHNYALAVLNHADSSVLMPSKSADLSKISQLKLSQRDPFVLNASTKNVIIEHKKIKKSINLASKTESTPVVKLPVLRAVVDGPDSGYVVLDDQIISEGGQYGIYKVYVINGTQVQLKGPDAQHTLSLSINLQGVGND